MTRAKILLSELYQTPIPALYTVAGAGSMLDLPLQAIQRENRTVILADIVPPLPAVREAMNLKGVSFLVDFESWSPPAGTDMVISVNILTQLAALPIDYLRRKTTITPDEEKLIRSTVQQRYLDMLQRYNSVLISDFAEVMSDQGCQEPPAPLLEADLPPGVFNEELDWLFDSHGGYNEGKITTLRVAGIVFRR